MNTTNDTARPPRPSSFAAQERNAQRTSEEHAYLQAQLDNLFRNHIDAVKRYHWALGVAAELARYPRGPLGWMAQCLPHGVWRWFQARQLRKKGLFDVRTYRRRYPDTTRSKFGPLAHFLRWGVNEGRVGGPNQAKVADANVPENVVEAILKSGLFDLKWYAKRYGFVGDSQGAAVRDYLIQSQIDPLRNPGPLFSGAYYILQNPDTAGVPPLLHFVTSGLTEGRRALSPVAADAFMEEAANEALNRLEDLLDLTKPTLVLCWQEGNFFFTDIATYLCDYLARRGCQAQRAFEDAGVDIERYNVVVVAPHEFNIHGPGRAWPVARLAKAIYVNTEQWHTSWFSLALGMIARSGKVLDINPASARGLCKLGMQAGFLPLLPLEGSAFNFPRMPLSKQTSALRTVKPLTYPIAPEQRPYDILYVAALNERRARIMASLAPHLAQYDCFLHTPSLQGPVKARSANMLPSADFSQLARNSKVLLNIHQGESRYFEWHRLFLSGICEGCVVVTEPCLATGVLKAGVHYLEIETGLMGQYLDWLLQTAEGKQKMADIHASCAELRDRLIGSKAGLP